MIRNDFILIKCLKLRQSVKQKQSKAAILILTVPIANRREIMRMARPEVARHP